MTTRFFTRVDINPLNPEARGICDRCGQQVTLSAMRWQHQYQGGNYRNTKWLVCGLCYDLPSAFLKVLQLPADPPATYNARPEFYAIDESTPWEIAGSLHVIGAIAAYLDRGLQFNPALAAHSGSASHAILGGVVQLNGTVSASAAATLTAFHGRISAALLANGAVAAAVRAAFRQYPACTAIAALNVTAGYGYRPAAALSATGGVAAIAKGYTARSVALSATGGASGTAVQVHHAVITATGSMTVPAGVTAMQFECIGGGGNGSTNSLGGAGGGAGAYAKTNSISVTPGQTVYYSIGAVAGDTWIRYGTNSAPTSTTDGCLAIAGTSASGVTHGNGGVSTSCVGDVKYPGGNGGANGSYGGGGAGGAAGPSGAGTVGANGAGNGGVGGAADNSTVSGANGGTSGHIDGYPGNAGTEFGTSYGCGSGPGGGYGVVLGDKGNGGSATAYGGAGAGAGGNAISGGNAGNGYAGLGIITYTIST